MPKSVDTPSGFAAMGLDPRLTSAIGYDEPSPIQREAIPHLIEGKDLIGLAGTGTGKTAAFALPIIHRLRSEAKKKTGVAVLILTPTRELAMQVAKAVKTYGKPLGVDVQAVYGGTSYSEQIRAIKHGVDVIVATPGRALDLIRKGKFPLDAIQTVVLDEADEMLDMGFADDMDAILAETPKTRQTMLFSATMPPRIEEIAKRHLRHPVRIKVAQETPSGSEAAKVRQTAYLVKREYKAAALGRILDLERPTSAIVFCRTRSEVDELVEMLSHRSFKPLALHGGLTQEQRDRVMGRFRSGQADLLIATDIAARGLDISHLSHVVNFDVPTQPDSYVHRIGRVGRAGRTGVAITLASPRERRELTNIERVTKQPLAFAPIPTAKDLHKAQIDRLRTVLRTALADTQGANELRGLLGELEKEFSTAEVALAALKLLHIPIRPEDEKEIPSAMEERRFPPERPIRGNPDDERKRIGSRPTRQGMAKVFFGIGRDAGVMARDLTVAISREAGVPRNDFGMVDLTDRFALVEVPADLAGYVVEAMQGVRIRGRKVNVRADRPPRQ
jgi:ATP-dependent RNA helicase DeaD